MRDDQEIEKDLAAASIGPRVTPQQIDDSVKEITFFRHKTLTIAVLELTNGFTVTGESACADPKNYNRELGDELAVKAAKSKIWALEGYLLRQRLYENEG